MNKYCYIRFSRGVTSIVNEEAVASSLFPRAGVPPDAVYRVGLVPSLFFYICRR